MARNALFGIGFQNFHLTVSPAFYVFSIFSIPKDKVNHNLRGAPIVERMAMIDRSGGNKLKPKPTEEALREH